MELRRKLLRAFLYADYGLRRLTGGGSFGSRRAVPITEVPPGIITGTLQQALWRHYVKQFNEAACSVASVATVINALRAVGGSGSRPLRQTEILDRVTAGHWKARMGPGATTGTAACHYRCWARWCVALLRPTTFGPPGWRRLPLHAGPVRPKAYVDVCASACTAFKPPAAG